MSATMMARIPLLRPALTVDHDEVSNDNVGFNDTIPQEPESVENLLAHRGGGNDMGGVSDGVAPRSWSGAWAVLPLVTFAALAYALAHTPLPWSFVRSWAPSLGLDLAFYVDGLSALLLVLILGVGTLVLVYAGGYMAGHPGVKRLNVMLLLFMAAMVGAVTADHLLVLFLFWELTSVLSFLLVGFDNEREASRAAARQALLVTVAGGLALLGGLILLAQVGGTWSMQELLTRSSALRDDPRVTAAMVLVAIGCFTKSAQLPFSFWLPNAMQAPTPVSAFLHSSTMVKLGVYLLARFDPVFNDLFLWEAMLMIVGGATAALAALSTLVERDLKRLLARSTVAALGTLVLLIGLPNPGAGLAVVALLFAHALYKAGLFFVVGNVDHACGTRLIDELRGLRRVMPWTTAGAVLAAISMAGLPLSFGFVAKDLTSTVKEDTFFAGWVSYTTLLVSAVAVAVAGIATIRAFWGPLQGPDDAHEVSWRQFVPPLFLGLIGLELEFVTTLADPLLLQAAQAISPGLGEVGDLRTSSGLKDVVAATGITLTVGVLIFVLWDYLHRTLAPLSRLQWLGAAARYQGILSGIAKLAAWHTRRLQHGSLVGYLRMVFSATILVVGAAWFVGSGHIVEPLHRRPEQLVAWFAALVLVSVATASALRTLDRLTLVMAAGLVGFACAVIFLFAGAPDLALTQLVAEIALVVVITLLLPSLGVREKLKSHGSLASAALAILAGVGMLALLLGVGDPQDPSLERWFGTNALTSAKGRNVVNVIIVDFRGLDTLGEIAVVAFALLASAPLLTRLSPEGSSLGAPRSGRGWPPEVAVRPLYWVALMASTWLLWRGHNEPGGGFAGGLVAAAGTAAIAIILGPEVARRRMPASPEQLALGGVLLALVSGLPGLVAEGSYLRHLWGSINVAQVEVKVSTGLIFDLGVLFAVWGAVSGFVLGLLPARKEAMS